MAAEQLAFVDRPQGARRVQRVGRHHQLGEAGLDILHAGVQHDAAAVDEGHVGEDVLDLLHLVGGHHDGPGAVEVVVDQAVVERLAVEDIEAQRRLVQHQQPGVDGHDQGQVQLGDHALGQFADPARGLDRGPGKEGFGLGAVEPGMDAGHIVQRLAHPHPAGKHGDIGDEADLRHQPIALGPGIVPQHPQFALEFDQPEHGRKRRALARAIGTDQAQDAAFLDAQIDAVQGHGLAVGLAKIAGFDAGHGFSPPCGSGRGRRRPAHPQSGPAAGWWRRRRATDR